ncbi:MAG: hypothetical protein ACC656_02185 [Candidatus Heimdallarchaeota archaeon]
MVQSLTRKGPQKVWDDYRNLRVPIEIFHDVKRYMEQRKYEYLTQKEGGTPSLELDENVLSMGPEVQSQIPSMLKQIIQEEFSKLQEGGGVYSIGAIPGRKKTSKERIKELLVQHKGSELSTTQISEILKMPGPTCRQAARELAKEDSSIVQYLGRPSRFKYVGE